MTGRSSRSVALATALIAIAAVPPTTAQDFYKGKTITIFVSSGSGGGFDINARMLARHINRHIPGRPDVIVSNMPGAAGLTAIRHVENVATKDGTSIIMFNFGLIGISKLTPDKMPVDFRKLAWLGSISQDLTMCYTWHKRGIKTLTELKATKGLHFGLSAPGGNEDINTKILKNVFGVEIKQVGGYKGSADQRLAIERGELDGGCGSWNSLPEDWIKGGLINPVYRTGPIAAPDMPPGLPYVLDLAPSPQARAVLRLLTAHNELGRPFALSQAVPADRLDVLRAAFAKTMIDPELIAEAAKLRMPVTPRSAAEAIRIVDDIYAAPDDVVAAARKVIE